MTSTLEQQYGTWKFPDGPEEWFIGDTKTISFEVEFGTFTVLFYQLDSKSGGIWTHTAVVVYQTLTAKMEFDWVVQAYDADLTLSDTFFFWLFNGTRDDERGNDVYPHLKSTPFRIREAREKASSSITSATTATTATLSTSVTLTTSTSAAAATSTSTTPQSSESSGSNNSTSIGIGISVGVAVALVLGLAAAYYLLWFRKKKNKRENDAAPETGNGDKYMYGDNTGPEELPAHSIQPAIGLVRPPSYHKMSQTPESWELDSTPQARQSEPVELGPGR